MLNVGLVSATRTVAWSAGPVLSGTVTGCPQGQTRRTATIEPKSLIGMTDTV